MPPSAPAVKPARPPARIRTTFPWVYCGDASLRCLEVPGSKTAKPGVTQYLPTTYRCHVTTAFIQNVPGFVLQTHMLFVKMALCSSIRQNVWAVATVPGLVP